MNFDICKKCEHHNQKGISFPRKAVSYDKEIFLFCYFDGGELNKVGEFEKITEEMKTFSLTKLIDMANSTKYCPYQAEHNIYDWNKE